MLESRFIGPERLLELSIGTEGESNFASKGRSKVCCRNEANLWLHGSAKSSWPRWRDEGINWAKKYSETICVSKIHLIKLPSIPAIKIKQATLDWGWDGIVIFTSMVWNSWVLFCLGDGWWQRVNRNRGKGTKMRMINCEKRTAKVP